MTELLRDRVNRMKARWLKRVMSAPDLNPTAKCFAYVVSDCLNCVTLDAWPGQETVARLLGGRNVKTVARAAASLVAAGFLTVTRRKQIRRYAPAFIAADADAPVPAGGQVCSARPDRNVGESFLSIPRKSSSTGAAGEANRTRFDPRRRGQFEMQVAKRLGTDGFEILARLHEIDAANLDRLCRAEAEGLLGEAELAAARLAARQAR